MREQARLKEEMAYMYKIGNFEVATDNSELISSVLLFPCAVFFSDSLCNCRQQLLFRKSWTQMLPCEIVVLCGKIPMAMAACLRGD